MMSANIEMKSYEPEAALRWEMVKALDGKHTWWDYWWPMFSTVDWPSFPLHGLLSKGNMTVRLLGQSHQGSMGNFFWDLKSNSIQARLNTIWRVSVVILENTMFSTTINMVNHARSLLLNVSCWQNFITLFAEYLTHKNNSNFLKSLCHRPQQTWHDLVLGSVTRCHRENCMKSMCTSFGEECTSDNYWKTIFRKHETWLKQFMGNYHLNVEITTQPCVLNPDKLLGLSI